MVSPGSDRSITTPPPLSRARYKTGGPAASDMDRSMLRQAGTRRTSQRARRSAFTVTWTSTPDPVDTAGVGMADTAPRVHSSSGLCANCWERRNPAYRTLCWLTLQRLRSRRRAVPQTGADVSEELDASKVVSFSEALVTTYWAALPHVTESCNLDTAAGTSNPAPRCTIFPANSTGAQWLKKFAAFSERTRFITVLTTDPTIRQLHPICTLTQYFPSITFNVRLPIHVCLDLPSDLSTWSLFIHYSISLCIYFLPPLHSHSVSQSVSQSVRPSVRPTIYGSTALCWALAAFQFLDVLHSR
jgi:hypothetical protein